MAKCKGGEGDVQRADQVLEEREERRAHIDGAETLGPSGENSAGYCRGAAGGLMAGKRKRLAAVVGANRAKSCGQRPRAFQQPVEISTAC